MGEREAALPPPARVLSSLGLGAFLSTLDGGMVNIALPSLAAAFGAPPQRAAWVVLAYLLALAGTLLLFGRLGDQWGHRRVYLVGAVVFGTGALAATLAPSLPALAAARSVQALGASMLQSVGPAILVGAFPARARGRALGLLSLFTYAGVTLGPLLGGWLTARVGFRSIFAVGVPLAAATALLAARSIPRDGPRRAAPLDLSGAALWATGLCAALIALDRGGQGGFRSPAVAALVAVAAVAAGLFVARERRTSHPVVDLALLRDPAFGAAVAAALANYVAVIAIFVLTPFKLVGVDGLSPAAAGGMLTAMPVAMVVCAPVAGELSDRIGPRGPAVIGLLVLAAGIQWLRTGAPPAAALALCGAGTGLFISPNTSAALGAAPPDRQGAASGLVATARTAGMALGVALASLASASALAAAGGDAEGERLHAYGAGLFPALVAALLGAAASALRPGRAAPARG